MVLFLSTFFGVVMLLIYETGPFPTVCVPFRIVPHPVDFNYLFFGYVKHSSGLRVRTV